MTCLKKIYILESLAWEGIFQHSILNVNGQQLTIIFSEPIGFSAPKFSSESKHLGDFSIKHLSSYNLNCPAQSSPAPSYRLVRIYFNMRKYGCLMTLDTQLLGIHLSHNKSVKFQSILDFRTNWDLCSKILHKLRHTWLIQVSPGISI